MKLTKRLAALALCLCLLCGIPLSVSAADNTITMEKAVLFSTTATHATFEVTFSDMVTFPKNGSGWSMMPQEFNAGCTSASKFQTWTASIEYVGNTVTDGTATYSKTVLMTFHKCQSHANNYATQHPDLWGADGATMPANLYITSTVNDSQGATAVSSDIIKGRNGETLKWTKTQGTYACAAIKATYGDFTSMITLKKAAVVAADENGYTVEATFSAPVAINKQVWVMGAPQEGGDSDDACQNWHQQSIEYVGSESGYSSVVRLTYKYCPTHKDLWKDSVNGGYKVPDSGAFPNGAYLFVNDRTQNHVAGSLFMSTEVICGENGKPVVQTNIENPGTANEYGELYAKLEDEIPEPIVYPTLDKVEFTGDPAILDGDYGVVYKVRLTFNKPVHFGGSWELTGNEHGGNFQSWTGLMGTNYHTPIHENPIYKDGNQTTAYSDTVLLHVTVRDYLASNANATADRFLTYLDSLGIRVTDATIDGGIQTIYDMDGNTVRATSNNNVNQERLFVAGTDNSAKIGTVVLGENVTMNANYTVPAGMTLDLNGNIFTAPSVYVAGSVIDSTQGDGKVAVAQGMLQYAPSVTGNVLPLYDTDGYRLFSVAVNQKNHRPSATKAEFGVAVVLGGEAFNEEAYTLLANDANADVALTFNMLLNGETPLTYTITRATMVAYAERVLSTPDREGNIVIVLSVYGIEEMSDGMTLAVTPELTTGTTRVVPGSTQTYQHTTNA